MKMTQKDFAFLKGLIERAVENLGGMDRLVKKYENGDFPRADKVKDLNKRFRWDLYWYVTRIYREENNGQHIHDNHFADLNSYHIDTALKRIVPVIKRKY